VQAALHAEKIRGSEKLEAKMTLEISAIGLTHVVHGSIELD